jgi:hypothetical protein
MTKQRGGDAVQYREAGQYRPPIEVISRLRIERKIHVVIAVGWKQHFQCSKRVHKLVGGENILDLAVRLRQRNKPLADPGGDNTIHQRDIAITVGRPSTDPSTNLEHAIRVASETCSQVESETMRSNVSLGDGSGECGSMTTASSTQGCIRFSAMCPSHPVLRRCPRPKPALPMRLGEDPKSTAPFRTGQS